jgi:hypothetical protein
MTTTTKALRATIARLTSDRHARRLARQPLTDLDYLLGVARRSLASEYLAASSAAHRGGDMRTARRYARRYARQEHLAQRLQEAAQ